MATRTKSATAANSDRIVHGSAALMASDKVAPNPVPATIICCNTNASDG